MSTNKKLNKNKLDKIYCKSIAKSIADVLKFSLNNDFRKQAFQSLGVLSTSQLQIEIQQKLYLILQTVNRGREKNKNKKLKCNKTMPGTTKNK